MLNSQMAERLVYQFLFPDMKNAHEALGKCSVCVIGMGALGSSIAEMLIRSGAGKLKIVDADIVELSNLQRQALYDEDDVGKLKVKAASEKMHKISKNADITECPVMINYENAENLLSGQKLIFDGTDRFSSRELINLFSWKLGIPWIHAAVTAQQGQIMTFYPGKTACFRCFLPEMPSEGSLPGTGQMGIPVSTVRITASAVFVAGMKLLSDEEPDSRMTVLDCWNNRFYYFSIEPDKKCPVCGGKIANQS